jgi:predicted TIM-barrel fold metal-dependent hydrolase
VDIGLVMCEYSPKVTGMQAIEDMLPLAAHNPDRVKVIANINPHLHYPVADELARQLDMGAAGLKIHPVHGGFCAADPALYPAYQLCQQEGVPVVVHTGTSSFPGSDNAMADPGLLSPVLRDFPGLTVVLAHGGRGWWYEAAASLALLHANVWIELSGLPPGRLPDYYARFNLGRLAGKFIFGTDWPGVPGIARNARAVAALDLPPDILDGVLGGHAQQVYRGLARR